jgi:hypothetical protein
MKKTLLTVITGLLTIFGFAQTTATDFTANDCSGNSHTLFTELDAGKVIVLTWVMPCVTCIKPTSIVANTTQGYASSNPGRVKFYLVDDYADDACSVLTDWATQNSISTNATFSNAIIDPLIYGGFGGVMQKTIVLGGANHTVFFNVNGAIPDNPVDLRTAIANALAATSGVVNNNNVILGLSLFPSPASVASKLNYTLTKSTSVTIDILTILGEKVNSISVGTQSPGKHEYQLNLESLSEGTYFVKLNVGDATQTIKLSVVR